MLRNTIHDDMVGAMKAGDKDLLAVLRYMWAEIKNEEIDLKHELNDDEVIRLLQKEVKRRKEAIVQFKLL